MEPNQEDVAEICAFLVEKALIGRSAAAKYASEFVKAGFDSLGVFEVSSKQEVDQAMADMAMQTSHQALIHRALAAPSLSTGSTAAGSTGAVEGKRPLTEEETAQKVMAIKQESNDTLNKIQAQSGQALQKTNSAATDALNAVKNAPQQDSAAKWDSDQAKMLSEVDQTAKRYEATGSAVTVGDYSSTAELLNSVSEGSLCKAVHFINDSYFGSKAARKLFDFVATAKRYPLSLDSSVYLHVDQTTFYSMQEYKIFKKQMESGGQSNSATASVAGYYAGISASLSASVSISSSYANETTNHVQAKSKHAVQTTAAVVRKNSFQIDLSKTSIDDGAMLAFNRCDTIQKAKRFLRQFGSHVLLTPQLLGGIFMEVVEMTFKAEQSVEQIDQATSSIKQASASVAVSGAGYGASAGYSHDSNSNNANSNKQDNDSQNYSTSSRVEVMGPQVQDMGGFATALAAGNKTYCHIGNSFDPENMATWAYASIWEVFLNVCDATDVSVQSNVRQLRDAWLSTTLDDKKLSVEPFMKSLIAETLEIRLPGDAFNWSDAFTRKSGSLTTRVSKIVQFQIVDPIIIETSWQEGATKGLDYLDRVPIKPQSNRILLGFRLACADKSGKKMQYVSTHGRITSRESVEVRLVDEKEHSTSPNDISGNIDHLDRHDLTLNDNRILTGFRLVSDGSNRGHFVYTSSKVMVDGEIVPIINSPDELSSEQVGATSGTCEWLDRHDIKVSTGKVLTGFKVEVNNGLLRYRLHEGSLGTLTKDFFV